MCESHTSVVSRNIRARVFTCQPADFSAHSVLSGISTREERRIRVHSGAFPRIDKKISSVFFLRRQEANRVSI